MVSASPARWPPLCVIQSKWGRAGIVIKFLLALILGTEQGYNTPSTEPLSRIKHGGSFAGERGIYPTSNSKLCCFVSFPPLSHIFNEIMG